MSITFRLPTQLSSLVGREEVLIEAKRADEGLLKLLQALPSLTPYVVDSTGTLRPSLRLYLADGRIPYGRILEWTDEIEDGAIVEITYAIQGG